MTITIHVSSEQVSKALLKEYNKQLGIFAAPIYWVPTYKMHVEGLATQEVIRVGLSRAQTHVPKNTRKYNVGIFKAHHTKSCPWIDYSPRTGPGTISGAVQIWKGRNFLIHEGPADRELAMGTYGCVEVLGKAEWKAFVGHVKSAGLAGKVEVIFDVLPSPAAELAVKDFSIKKTWADALYQKCRNAGKYQVELTEADVDKILASAKDKGGVSRQEVIDLYYIWLNYAKSEAADKKMHQFLVSHAKAIKK